MLSNIPDGLLALLWLSFYLAGVGLAAGLTASLMPCWSHAKDCPSKSARCAEVCDCGNSQWFTIGSAHYEWCSKKVMPWVLAPLWPVSWFLLPALWAYRTVRPSLVPSAHGPYIEALEAESRKIDAAISRMHGTPEPPVCCPNCGMKYPDD